MCTTIIRRQRRVLLFLPPRSPFWSVSFLTPLCEMELPSTEEIVQLGYDVWVSLCDLYPLTLFLRTVVSQHGHEGGSTYIEGAFCILTPPSTIPQLLWPCMYTTTV